MIQRRGYLILGGSEQLVSSRSGCVEEGPIFKVFRSLKNEQLSQIFL